ncbi:MAG: hypothetical protein S4CHLAM102_00530 [Chlamydiia bacterium]|nr:hypothetical protein [Chlamydiia bacterium]
MRWILLVCLSLVLFGCGGGSSMGQSLYHDDGRVKPKVAFVTVYDTSGSDLPWNLGEEFADRIEGRFYQQNKLFLLKEFSMLSDPAILSSPSNPFIGNNEWIREIESRCEFVVFLELIQHEYLPREAEEGMINALSNRAFDLNIAMRVKVVDIRGAHPKAILSEIVKTKTTVPWQYTGFDYQKTAWGKPTFSISPMGLAHTGFAKQVASQIEEYIILAKANQ